MHLFLYTVAAMCALMGVAGGWLRGDFDLMSNGLLAAMLCGAFGRIVHLLTRIEEHLRLGQIQARMREERRIADTLFPARPARITARDKSMMAKVRRLIEDVRK